MNNVSTGTLFIVSTPIGNLEDITLRALRILKEVDLIAAEDTRKTRKLLTHYEINTPLTSFFEGNQQSKTEKLIERLKDGDSIALVSDAGTPTISDPGYPLLRQCISDEVRIVSVPGVSAILAAAAVSGLPLHNFIFEGFLSPKSGKRKRQLTQLAKEERTLILFESPHRICRFLEDALEIMGEREIVITRELTKHYEEIFRGNFKQALEKFSATTPRGEFTIVIGV
ncbi:16S rRNA (cytidine(1402)-2'-O)-methyltransferase [Candidatus Poribacteria bacterium]|nr:16S rRNA (cytidine(1402)-2'-O)-methyltransferase [Candidatus Poribacteria bacterium]MYB65911.1 16S rRNA (cytidine(1402)-2'-O)-methyltransferase [Candidatus Poribacteria bacterium]MYF55137.1 16S rRNA (cytidine(1402)-2'-O)-methyltransferase [Candidatus Poribacteria bacterium]MYI94060.1 16S rRNA (cytidine(1402)-2'-O)-methyltransferase [Candidatus Poribacteria bacterium]